MNADTPSSKVPQTTAQHTPGPWRVIRLTKYEPGQALYVVPLNNELHPVSTVWANQLHYTAAENEANAEIMAAAPDLYAALVDLLEVAEDLTENTHPLDKPDIKHALIVNARAAIAKAEGRS